VTFKVEILLSKRIGENYTGIPRSIRVIVQPTVILPKHHMHLHSLSSKDIERSCFLSPETSEPIFGIQ
jgi:hypothetical protein